MRVDVAVSALILCLLVWAPLHFMWLVPAIGYAVAEQTISFGFGNLIGLYSSLIPLGLVGAVLFYVNRKEQV